VALVIAVAASLSQPSRSLAAEPDRVTVMTRNLYLGSDLGGIQSASSFSELLNEAGEVFHDVDATKPRLRMRALGAEILRLRPDLVALQEVSLWRLGPPDGAPLGGTPATTVRYDFLKLLLSRLNKGRKRYRVVGVQNQADAEIPADTIETGNDTPEIDGRLTDRDAILARVGVGVRTRRTAGGHFENRLEVTVAGFTAGLDRGWISTLANVRGTAFKLVNTHLEAADATVRTAQADELVRAGGPARSARLPVVLIGDVNSDDDSVSVANRGAFLRIAQAGFVARSTSRPSCCYQSELLDDPASFFDHQVDHVLVNRRRIRLGRSSVTGIAMTGGRWHSDHGGVFSALLFS
jgi:endonuclease/exonuclease/phosphatase family metal-dependent hydrolase